MIFQIEEKVEIIDHASSLKGKTGVIKNIIFGFDGVEFNIKFYNRGLVEHRTIKANMVAKIKTELAMG